MHRDLPSGTVTFLFTDVEGSTRLLHERGAVGYAEALAEHRRVIREACAAEGGVEVDTQGDAFFFAFPTAPGALAAASAFTEALASGPVSVRVGVHTGTPLLTGEGYVGADVHFAARVAASAHGGQVVCSAATAALVQLPLTELGEHRLKDVEGPVAIFQLGDGRFPPLKTISNTNLPRPASSFVGRERELDEVLARVREGARLLTLTGPGGSGKTRLALEAAAELVPEFNAGVFWVGLAALRDPALVTETVAQTLGAKDGLAEHVGERELLLLLDNLEQVIEAAPELASLLERCPSLTLLVTSRELLRVRGEVEYPVPPLASPEAVELFCVRSRLGPSDEVAELCARLDNLPLAVELAAARTKALTVSQILERLSQRLDLLKGGRDADPRQQTLRATIEWSCDLLSPDEQQLFARLSVFAGGCTLEAAEQVADADLDTLQSLVEKSLLRFTDGRYWMLETIREHAREKLERAGDDEALSDGHGDFFLASAETIAPQLRTSSQLDALDRITADLENYRAALNRFSEHGHGVSLARLATALSDFWWRRGRPREGCSWSKLALARYTEPTELLVEALRSTSELCFVSGDPEARAIAVRSVALSRELGQTTLLARCLNNLGAFELAEGRFDEAAKALHESAELRRRHDRDRLGRTLGNLANLELRRGNLSEARRLLEECLGLDADVFDRAIDHASLGEVASRSQDFAVAQEWYGKALRAFVELGATQMAAQVLVDMAEAAVRSGDVVRAAELVGAAKRQEEISEASDDPDYLRERDAVTATVRDLLGEEPFDQAVQCGFSRTTDEAVEHALALSS